MTERLTRFGRRGGYRGGSSKKPVVVPTSTGASVNKQSRRSNQRS